MWLDIDFIVYHLLKESSFSNLKYNTIIYYVHV